MSGARRGPPFGQTWWGRAWVEGLEQRARLDPNRLPRAVAYARSGAVGELTVAPGEVRATVEGRDSQPYAVRIRVRQFDDAEWVGVFDAIGAQLSRAVALLEGEFPPEVVADLDRVGLSLLPGAGEIGLRCTCPDEADPCKHSAAVCYLLADALDADPLVALLLRGRSRDEVLSGLRSRRRDLQPVSTNESDDGTPALLASAVTSAAPASASPVTEDVAPPREVDEGVDARAVLAATSWGPVPAPPLPPRRAGRPVAWPLDPPPQFADVRADLIALASDAASRAWEFAVGASPDAGLALDVDADLARRACALLGRPGFADLARRCAVRERELARWALAWRHGGAAGFDVLRHAWDPATEGEAGAADVVGYGRVALREVSGVTRTRGNRVTAGRMQLRLGRDYRWYPYQRAHGHWDAAGPPDDDPVAVVARTWQTGR